MNNHRNIPKPGDNHHKHTSQASDSVGDNRAEGTDDSPHIPLVKLGGQPGRLLAALPAILSFTPANSLVIVGLFNAAVDEGRRMRVGPVVRADLHESSYEPSMRKLVESLKELPQPEAVVFGIHPDLDLADRWVTWAADELELHGITIHGVHLTAKLASGEPWYQATCAGGDLSDLQPAGEIEAAATNPVDTIRRCYQQLSFATREERELWLEPESVLDLAALGLHHPMRLEVGPDGELTVAGIQETCMRDQDELVDALAAVFADVEQGSVVPDACCERPDVHANVFQLIQTGDGCLALLGLARTSEPALVRDVLVHTIRISEGVLRHRLMAILAYVLAMNGEHALSLFTLQQATFEAQSYAREQLTCMFGHDCESAMCGDVGEYTDDYAEDLLEDCSDDCTHDCTDEYPGEYACHLPACMRTSVEQMVLSDMTLLTLMLSHTLHVALEHADSDRLLQELLSSRNL